MIDVLLDGLIDTLKLIPYLLATFLILEWLEHKLDKKNEKILRKNQKLGPIIGSLLGALPQCGFGAIASSLYATGVITMGTLIAVFLSTSDEMLPIMIGEQVNTTEMLKIIGFKIIVGILAGFLIDLFVKQQTKNNIEGLCHKDHCDCEDDGIVLSSIKHTIKITLFILIANILINSIIYIIGEDTLENILLTKNIITYFIASFIGLIPNCVSSIIITELYLSGYITIGTLLSGLLTGSGVGLLILFRENEDLKENIKICSILYLIGVIIGMIIDYI